MPVMLVQDFTSYVTGHAAIRASWSEGVVRKRAAHLHKPDHVTFRFQLVGITFNKDDKNADYICRPVGAGAPSVGEVAQDCRNAGVGGSLASGPVIQVCHRTAFKFIQSHGFAGDQ